MGIGKSLFAYLGNTLQIMSAVVFIHNFVLMVFLCFQTGRRL